MNDEVWQTCIDQYGVSSQIDMCIEECSELINAIQKYKRDRVGVDALIDEIADVKIMCRQMEIMFDCENEVKERIKYKANRQRKRLSDDK